MTEEEKRHKLRKVYSLLISLASEDKTTPTKTLVGTEVGVTGGDAQRQPQDHYTPKGAGGQGCGAAVPEGVGIAVQELDRGGTS